MGVSTSLALSSLMNGAAPISLGPASAPMPLPRIVTTTFSDPNSSYLSVGKGDAGGQLTFEAPPIAAPDGQAFCAKVQTAQAVGAEAAVRSFPFAAGAANNVPKTFGSRPFVKAPGQVLWALVFVPSDAYNVNSSMNYADQLYVRAEVDSNNSVNWFFTTSGVRLKSGWNFLVMRWDEVESDGNGGPVPFTLGSVPYGATIARVMVGGIAGSSAGFSFYAASTGYFAAPPARPLWWMTFDGGYAEHRDLVLPILQARGLRATFTTGAGVWANDRSLPDALVAAGMEVGQQVWQHIDYPQAGDAAYAAQLSSAICVMRGMGYAHYIQSMPYNDITRAQVDIAAGMGVKLLREARQTITPILPWGLGSGAINVGQFGTDNKTLPVLKLAVDAAVRYGGLLTTTTHQLIPGGDGVATTGSTTQTYVNDLTAMVDYALSQGVTIVTGGQLLDSLAALKALARYG